MRLPSIAALFWSDPVVCTTSAEAGCGARTWLRVALLAWGIALSPAVLSESQGETGAQALANPPHIFIASTDGSSVTPLTEGLWPAWSPDGAQIAFFRAQGSVGGVFIINADGTGETWLAPGVEPAWSPDGTSIAYASAEGITVLDLHVFGTRTLVRHDFLAGLPADQGGTYAPLDQGVGKPAYSPDGAQIAFEHRGDEDMTPAQAWVMNADGSGVRRISSAEKSRIRYAESDPAWSPDGSRIALWSYGYGIASILMPEGIASTVYHDFPNVAYGARPAWSPDGRLIAFAAGKWNRATRAVWVVDSGGGSPVELIPLAYDPAWSPDGKHIAFVSGEPQSYPLPGYPPVSTSGPVSVYERVGPHTIPPDWHSRYVLYDDGTFELQFSRDAGPPLSYRGEFSRTGSSITLDFDDDTRWQALGSFNDDRSTLHVEYNVVMSLSDFEDGTYILTSQLPEGPVKNPDEPLDPPPPSKPCDRDCRLSHRPKQPKPPPK